MAWDQALSHFNPALPRRGGTAFLRPPDSASPGFGPKPINRLWGAWSRMKRPMAGLGGGSGVPEGLLLGQGLILLLLLLYKKEQRFGTGNQKNFFMEGVVRSCQACIPHPWRD